MADIPDSISTLSNEELRRQLLAVGIAPAPLTPTTRRIFQRKLAKKLSYSQPIRNICKELDQEAKENVEPATDGETKESGDADIKRHAAAETHNTGCKSLQDEDIPQKELSESGIYYAVAGCDQNGSAVFVEKQSALKHLMKHKKGRLQSFQSRKDAESYMKSSVENVDSNTGIASICKDQNVVSEKSNQFKMPKQKDLNELSKAIEQGNVDTFKKLVWENPRYLINSADAPVVIKPPTRYNALHTASRFNQPELVKVIMETLQKPEFQSLMYSSDQVKDCNTEDVEESRVEHILDLYLNTPDKILCETPLHFASKLGFVDVVSELVSLPLCCKTVKNKNGETPEDVVCSRQGSAQARQQILQLLKDQFYVPLIRCHDNSQTPVVAPPWTPSVKKKHPIFLVKSNPLEPVHVVSAVAGPMSSADAKKMQHSWMTPDRKALEGKRMSHIRRSDMDRGDERIGRELAKKAGVSWIEYWEFLDNYADFSTPEGLLLLEAFLEKRFEELKNHSFNESSVFLSHEDSLNDLCTNLCDLRVSEDTSQEGTTAPNLQTFQDRDTWWNLSSTPTQKSKPLDYNTNSETSFQDKRLESLRENLLKVRQMQLQKVTSISYSEHHFVSPKELRTRTPPAVNSLSDSFRKVNLESSSFREIFNSTSSIAKTPERSTKEMKSPPLNPAETDDNRSSGLKNKAFISGTSPSKLDTDVILAIGSTEVSENRYPYVWSWMKAVLCFSEEDRQKWKTPTRASRSESCLASPLKMRHTPLKSPWPASPLAKTKWGLPKFYIPQNSIEDDPSD